MHTETDTPRFKMVRNVNGGTNVVKVETQKHTPTPKLRLSGKGIKFLEIQTSAGKWTDFENSTIEQDESIVRAVNSHDALVLALELQEALHMPSTDKRRSRIMEVAGYKVNDDYDAEYTFADFVADKRAEALALAKGE